MLPHGRPVVLVPLFLCRLSLLTLFVCNGTSDTAKFPYICFIVLDSIKLIGVLKSITHCLDYYAVRIRFGICFW